MNRNERLYFQHILDAIAKIEKYVLEKDEQEFTDDTLLQDGVIRQLEIIGEAVKRLSSTTRSLQSHIPWSAIAGMRDKLIHDYFMVDINQVWLAAVTDIPPLKTAIIYLIEHVDRIKKE